MNLFRFRFKKDGAHIRVLVDAGRDENKFVGCGEMFLSTAEWEALQERLVFGQTPDGAQIETMEVSHES